MQKKYFSYLKQSTKDYRFWIKLVLGLSQILSIFIFITYTYVRSVKGWGTTERLVPGYYSIGINLSYFTTISNLLCGIFFFHSAFFHHQEGMGKFNNDSMAKTVVVSITLTLIIYNVSELGKSDPYHFNYFVDWLSLIFEHSVGPVVAVLYYIFLYNHKDTKDWKTFSKKYLWLTLLMPVIYGIFFWILGELSKVGNGLGLYYWNGANKFGEGSHFPYPFLDFSHTPIFIKNISGAAESVVMLLLILLATIMIAYLYTWGAIDVRKYNWQKKLFIKQKTHNKKS